MKNKFLLFFTTFLLVLPQVWSQSFIEDFELQTVLTSSYANGSFEGAEGITFSYVHSRNEGLGTGDDYSIEGKGIMLRRADEPSSLEFTLPNGVGNLSFDYRKAFTGGNNNRQLAVFVNGVQEFVTPMFGGPNADPTIHNFSGDINVSGPTTIKITYPTGTANGNKQITIDNITWTASETPSDYSITVTQAEGGNISPSGTVEVEEGGTIEFTATADACYAFSHWVVDGENAGNTNPYVFTNVTGDHTITAVFDTVAPYTITATAGANGSISPTGEVEVNCGEDQIFNMTPDAGYTVSDVLVDGVSVGAVTSYTFTNLSENHTITVSFEEFSEPGEFCGTEDFENIPTSNSGSYLERTWTGDSGITWSATDARTDQIITGKAIGLRSSTLTNTSIISGGIGTISFDYKRIYANNSTLKLFVNGVQYGGDITVTDETPTTFTTEVNITGDVTIQIINSGNRTAVDNLAWTCPEPPCETPLPTAVAQSFCGTTTVADLVAEGTDLKWYESLEATEPLSFDAEITTRTYYVSQTIDCESERLAVEITVNTIPDSPVAEAQELCEGATVADLLAEGTGVKWYETEDSTEPLAADFVLVTGTYYVTQTIEGCESEKLAVEITINNSPVFTTQPIDQTVAPGETASFVAEAEGTSTYQWSVSTDGGANWTVLDGATEATYTTEPATLEMDGNQYRVSATNDCGEMISETAILNVEEISCEGSEDFETTDIPSSYSDGSFTHNGITWTYGHSRNEDTFGIEGKGLMLRRASDSYLETTLDLGVGEFTFEYRKAFTGGNDRQLELIVNGEQVAMTPVFGAGSGEDPTVHTFTHTLDISEPVVIRIKNVGTSADNRQTVIDNISWTCPEETCETPLPTAEAQIFCGEATVADLVAEGENIQWYETQTSTEPLAPEVELITGTYYVTQTIDCESDRLAVDVLISEGPVFTLQPEDQTVSEGETATFTVEVEGALEYQWSVSTDEGTTWVIIDGATEATYTTDPATQEMDGNQYRITATNDCGETISEIAILTLVGEPCFVEDFETTDISDTYSDGSFTNNGITWTYGHSRNQGDFPIDSKGLMLRRALDSYLEATIPAGAGVFSFEYRKAFTGGNERQLELIVNGVQVATTPVFGTGSGEDTTVYTFTYVLDTTEEVVIRIKNVGETDSNRQTVIDNINWTCLEEPCDVPAPVAIGNFEFVAGETLADLEDSLEYTGTLTWYADEELTMVLPDTTLLEDGAVYFVTQTIGECESEALTVETHELGIDNYGLNSFSYYPNPVKDILSLKNGSVINRVEIYNLSGAKVWTSEINAAQAELNLSGLDTGIYVMKITAGKEVKTVKIIKK